ncbi:MAG: MOSC domain-containing protein [Dehalococcoidia bacterium]
MGQGTVVSINIAREASGPMEALDQVSAVAGQGLEGDRYFAKQGSFSKTEGAGRELTLIESEAIDALGRDYDVKLPYGDARRNIVTRGVALNHLVGKEFSVGEVRLRGVRLSEPCNHLAGLTKEKVRPGLVHRGGLRADILNDGVIRVGDTVQDA